MKNNRYMRLNVGFLLKETAGYKRAFEFEAAWSAVSDDLEVKHLGGKVLLTRTPQGLYASGRLTGFVQAQCVGCLDEFSQPLSAHIAELFVFPPENASPGESVVLEDGFIDLGPIVRDDMLLSAPIRAICRADCKGLCPQCGANRSQETCDCANDEVDPRLATLRVLMEER